MSDTIIDIRQSDIEEGRGRGAMRQVGGVDSDRLRSLVERIERLEEDRKALSEDIKDIYKEAASAGYDAKVLRELIAERRKDPKAVEELQSLLDVYRSAVGR
jgi:uncharacterized protein (UPF0335 family)